MGDKTPKRPPKQKKKVEKFIAPTIKIETASLKKFKKGTDRNK